MPKKKVAGVELAHKGLGSALERGIDIYIYIYIYT